MTHSLKDNEQGFTILELVIGVTVSMLLLSLAARLLVYQQEIFNEEAEITEMHQNLRFAMDMIVKEVKMAGYNPNPSISFDGIPDDTKLKILANLNGDGDTTDEDEEVEFSFATNTIIREDINFAQAIDDDEVIAENITDVTFNYRDKDGAVTTTEADIYQVWISITGRTGTDTRLKDTSIDRYRYGTLTTFITPPNLKYDDD